jgi:hypothetical protein
VEEVIILYAWLIGSILLLSVALTVFDAMGDRMSDEAIWLYTIIATFWPICLAFGLIFSTYNSYKARQLFKKERENAP